ncbi:hypothetical protein PYCC9005_000491 [Savitreella phatthalungensis]
MTESVDPLEHHHGAIADAREDETRPAPETPTLECDDPHTSLNSATLPAPTNAEAAETQNTTPFTSINVRRSGTDDSLRILTNTPAMLALNDIESFPSPTFAVLAGQHQYHMQQYQIQAAADLSRRFTDIGLSDDAISPTRSSSISAVVTTPSHGSPFTTHAAESGPWHPTGIAHASPLDARRRSAAAPRNPSPRRQHVGLGSPLASGSRSTVVPPTLAARLQQRHQDATSGDLRIVSLQVTQPLDQVEVPRMQRTRSSSNANVLSLPQLPSRLQRETSLTNESAPSTPSDAVSAITQTDETSEERFSIAIAGKQRSLNATRQLGLGTFSRVLLCTVEKPEGRMPTEVALKIVKLEAAGGAERARVETSVRREIDLLTTLGDHPLIIRLLGFSVDTSNAWLALSYCAGGDLFTLASSSTDYEVMKEPLVRRLFAELVVALLHMHGRGIVHRDIKLENVLLIMPADTIARHLSSGTAFPHLLTRITDLGLARTIDLDDPASMTTRCGSEDYAAPEVIMGQRYDGRQTDAWAAGCVLYCLLEGRLPFDLIPGLEHKVQSRVLHRICKIEWRWVRLRSQSQSQSPSIWEGPKRIVTNLLRSRTKRATLSQVAQDPWLRDEIAQVTTLVDDATQNSVL